MNYLGVYHSSYPKSTTGVCDAPCISKGRMMLCAGKSASEGYYLAMSYGRVRNREELIHTLKCEENISNSELILQAYRQWGINYPKEIEGPVVTCLLDAKKEILVLSRDRMGENPVFYSEAADGRVIFSDHPDTLLKTAAAEPVIDECGLCELFALGPARTPGLTPLRDIKSLEPGCTLVGKNGHVEIKRYFSIHPERHLHDIQETIQHTRFLLDQAVDEVVSLNPGVMLSGGLDSTALTALLSLRQSHIESFSVDYRDDHADFSPNAFRPERDSHYVEIAAKAFNTEHRNFVIEQAVLADKLEEAVSARGFPGMADIDSSLLIFAEKISRHKRIVLSGECGDEVFGGYPWFKKPNSLQKDFPWSGSMDLRERILRPELRKRLRIQDYANRRLREAIHQTEIDGPTDDSEINLKRMQLICFRYFMANLQERAVRMCGNCGVAVLTPFCDDRLAQYIFNVPWNIKFLGGMEKGLLRAAVQDCVPVDLIARKKSPYPKTSSPIYTEIIRGLIMAMLTDREAPILQIIDPDAVRSLADSALNPAETPWFGQLMAGPQMLAYLWQVNTWMRDRDITVVW